MVLGVKDMKSIKQLRAIWYESRSKRVSRFENYLTENNLHLEFSNFRRTHKYVHYMNVYYNFFRSLGLLNIYYQLY